MVILHSHFTEKETAAERSSPSSKITQWRHRGTQAQMVCTERLCDLAQSWLCLWAPLCSSAQ